MCVMVMLVGGGGGGWGWVKTARDEDLVPYSITLSHIRTMGG